MAEIEMKPVAASSRVKALGYDAETETLRAEFPNGRVAEYDGVPQQVYDDLWKGASVGGNFGALIVAGGYSYRYV